MLSQLEFALDVIPQDIMVVEWLSRLRDFQLDKLVTVISNLLEQYPGFGRKLVSKTNLVTVSLDFILRNECEAQ